MPSKKPFLSIIIPALNEEEVLSNLLDDILKNTYKDYEIIVGDNNSTDNTRKIVKKYAKKYKNIKLAIAKKRGIIYPRNAAAKKAQGKYLLFIDADARLQPSFLRKCVKEVLDRNIDCAAHYSKPDGGSITDRAMFHFVNLLALPAQYLFPIAPGSAVIVKKTIHKKVNGYQPKGIAEDHDYVRRCAKHGKFRMATHNKEPINMRRFEEENVWAKWAQGALCYILNKEMKHITYNFGHYKKKL